MKYCLIGFVKRAAEVKRINENIEAKNKKAAMIVAKELIKKAENYPTHEDSSFELCKLVHKFRKDKNVFFQNFYRKA